MASQEIYENIEMDENKETCKRGALPIPSPAPPKRTSPAVFFLVILVILLAALLVAVTILYFRKPKNFPKQKEVIPKDNVSRPLCIISDFTCELAILDWATRTPDPTYLAAGNLLIRIPDDWKFNNGSFYFFSEDSKPWLEAEEDCVSRGAHLTSVTSVEEMNYLSEEAKGKAFWIGLSDPNKDDELTWADGTQYNPEISFWGPLETSGDWYEDGDCVKILGPQKEWINASCLSSSQWICEKTLCREGTPTSPPKLYPEKGKFRERVHKGFIME